jgi:hypothetical protein
MELRDDTMNSLFDILKDVTLGKKQRPGNFEEVALELPVIFWPSPNKRIPS